MTDRSRYTRVTEVLYPFSGLDKVDAGMVAAAGERGTKVHKICEGIVAGLGELGVDKQTAPYVASFNKWWAEGHDVLAMEQRFYCDELELSGQCDLIIQTATGAAIVDLKTSYKPSLTWPAQGNAYCYLAKKVGYNIQHILFIHLSKHGHYPTIYSYPIDPLFFLDILRVYNHFYRTTQDYHERFAAKDATAA